MDVCMLLQPGMESYLCANLHDFNTHHSILLEIGVWISVSTWVSCSDQTVRSSLLLRSFDLGMNADCFLSPIRQRHNVEGMKKVFLSSVWQVLSILYSKWIPVPQCALSRLVKTLEVLYVWSGNEGVLWRFQGIEFCRRIVFNEPTRTISPSKYLLCTSTPARQAVFWHVMRWMSHKLFSQVVLFPSLPPPLLKCSKA